MADDNYIRLSNVRVSFPDIFKRSVYQGTEGKYSATLVMDPKSNADSIKKIEAEIENLLKTKLKGAQLPSDKICLKDGKNTTRKEYNGHKVIRASSDQLPVVLKPGTRDRAENIEESGIYSGCYVDVDISLWGQNNAYGKRINAQLVGIRFRADGEDWSGMHVDADEVAQGFEVDDDDAFLDAA